MKRVGKGAAIVTAHCLVCVCIGHVAFAQEDLTIRVGQTRVFTTFNHHLTAKEGDPGNPVPLPSHMVATSQGNSAAVSVSATPGTAGVSKAWIGLTGLRIDTTGYTYEEFKDMPVRVAFTFEYTLQANLTPRSGSADASMALGPFVLPWYDWVNPLSSGGGAAASEGPRTTKSYYLTVGTFHSDYMLYVYAHAHSADNPNGPSAVNSAAASARLYAIEFSFGREPEAMFECDIEKPQVGEVVTCTSTTEDDGEIAHYLWEIFDEAGGLVRSFEDTPQISRPFTRDQQYVIRLTVWDDNGLKDTHEKDLPVKTPAPTVTSRGILSSPGVQLFMGNAYIVGYEVKNNARVPIIGHLVLTEQRHAVVDGLSWDPFDNDNQYGTQDCYFEIEPESTQLIVLPCSETTRRFEHRWNWIAPVNGLQAAVAFLAKFLLTDLAGQLSGFNLLATTVDYVANALKIGLQQESTLPHVGYNLVDAQQTSWWRAPGGADPQRELEVPAHMTPIRVPDYKRDLFELAQEGKVAATFFTAAGSLLRAEPIVALPFYVAEVVELIGAHRNYQASFDPPDTDYAVVGDVQPVQWPEIQGIVDPLGHALASQAATVLALTRAHARALDRYQGAELAADDEWMARQMQIAADHASEATTARFQLAALAQQQVSTLPAVTAEDIAAARDFLATEGLPQIEVDILGRELGFTSAETDRLAATLLETHELWNNPADVVASLVLFSAVLNARIAADELMHAIRLNVHALNQAVVALTDDQRAELAQARQQIQAAVDAGALDATVFDVIQAQIAGCNSLLKLTNNWPAVAPYLEHALASLGRFTFAQLLEAVDAGSRTVWVGDCDSGVSDRISEGRFISQWLADCLTLTPHGALVSCVAHTTKKLVSAGVVTGRDKGAIQRCAARVRGVRQ